MLMSGTLLLRSDAAAYKGAEIRALNAGVLYDPDRKHM